jgi:hypothetical protein
MNNRRDIFILIALFCGLVLYAVLGPANNDEGAVSSLPTTYAANSSGALALYRWLGQNGYDAQRFQFQEYRLDDEAAVLFILDPQESFNRTEAREVLRWVEAGGTLIFAEDQVNLFGGAGQLLEELEVDVVFYEPAEGEPETIARAPVLQPLFANPPAGEVLVNASRILNSARPDALPLVGLPEATVLLVMPRGEGLVYVSSSAFPFTNAGLAEPQNAALVLNLLRGVPAGATILFDEYHHGYYSAPTLRSLVLSSPWGWALIYGMLVLAAYLTLTGRRFGAPIPLREETRLRSSAEYVDSMADLFQRGGKSAYVLRHYHTSFKRRLARPFGISPGLDDAAFVKELARYRDLDEAQLQGLLTRMRKTQLGEDELLRLVAEADAVPTRG